VRQYTMKKNVDTSALERIWFTDKCSKKGGAKGKGRTASIGIEIPGFQLGDLESCRTAYLKKHLLYLKMTHTRRGGDGEEGRGVGGHLNMYNE
jgi:hypothetical protein